MPTQNELVGAGLFLAGVVLVAVGPTVGGIAGLAVGTLAVTGLAVGTIVLGTAAEAEPVRDVGAD